MPVQTAPRQWQSAAQIRRGLRSAVEGSLVEYVLRLGGNHRMGGWALFRRAAAAS